MVDPPLLATKLFLPPLREKIVERPQLFQKLDSAWDKKLILVTAPAGYGKTTLVASWLARERRSFAWISLDENDNVPLRFLSYLAKALEQINGSDYFTAKPLIHSPAPPTLEVILTCLVNDMAVIDKAFLLVLDDYHAIHDAEVRRAVNFLIDNGPPGFRCLILSRELPDAPLSGLRARDQLAEVDIFDLRFNQQEASEFLNGVMGLDLLPEEVSDLDRRIEGWVTGLQLVALSMGMQPGATPISVDVQGDDRLIADYLVDEVLSNQTQHIQQFLMQSSIFNQFCPALCDSVLGIENSWETIQQLEQARLFIVPLDNRRQWYRYHHLFADMLRSRLKRLWPEIIDRLYGRSVDWHLEEGLLERAIYYAIEGQDYERAAETIQANLPGLMISGKRELMVKWYRRIPLSTLRTHTPVWVSYIMVLFYYGRFKKAHEVLRELWDDPSAINDMSEEAISITRGYAAIMEAAIVRSTICDADRALSLSDQALALLPVDAHLGRGLAHGHQGNAQLMMGDVEEARDSFDEAIRLIRLDKWPVSIVYDSQYARALAISGRLRRSLVKFESIFHKGIEQNIHKSGVIVDTLLGYARLEYEWNNLEKAKQFILDSVKLCENNSSAERQIHLLETLLDMDKVEDAVSSAETGLKQLEDIALQYSYPPYVQDRIEALWARLAIKKRDLLKARSWRHYFQWTHQDKVTGVQRYEWHTVAIVQLAERDYSKSADLLTQLQSGARGQGRIRDEIRLGVDLVHALFAGGEQDLALDEAARLLNLASAEGYVRSFVDGGPLIKMVLARMLDEAVRKEKGSVPLGDEQIDYIRQILAAFSPADTHERVQAITSASAVAVGLLTPRELDVVRQLSTGSTYAQISRELVITENTLKYHIKHIYSKLGVHNRTEAILRAQELQLV